MNNLKNKLSKIITLKVSGEQLAEIDTLAAKCGLSRGAYLRQRALGYEPRTMLSAEELRLLQNLDGCRVDIINFINFVSGLDREQRRRALGESDNLRQWLLTLAPIVEKVTDFINSVKKRGGAR